MVKVESCVSQFCTTELAFKGYQHMFEGTELGSHVELLPSERSTHSLTTIYKPPLIWQTV